MHNNLQAFLWQLFKLSIRQILSVQRIAVLPRYASRSNLVQLTLHETVSCYTICMQTNSREQLFLLHRWIVFSHTLLWLGMFRTKGMKMNAENEDAVLRPID
jgi:hypothetical protein